MTTVERRPIAGRVGRGLGWSTASNLVLRTGNFLISILMARLIAPEQFGVFAVALTIWSVLGTLAEFGLGTDLIRARDLERRIPTVATLGLVTSATLALSMAIAARPLAAAFDSPESAGVIRLMSVSLVVFGFSIVPAALLQREFRQGTLFAINGSALFLSATTMGTLAALGWGASALAWGQIVSQLVIVSAQYAVTRVGLHLGFDRRIARESASFCLPLAFANLLSWLLISVDNLVVARALGPTELGLYVLAFNVSSWPMNAVGQSVRVVALPAFSRFDSAVARNRALVLTSGPIWAVSLLMGVLLATLATPAVVLLYGDRWRGAAVALAGLAAFGALRVVFDLLATFLIAVGVTRSVLAVQVWWLLVMVPAMVVGVGRFGLEGAGWTHAVVAAVAVLPAYLFCLHRVAVDWGAFLRAWLPPTVAVVPTAGVCWYVADHVSSPLPAVLLGGTAALVLYVAPLAPWWIRQVRVLKTNGLEPADDGSE